VFCPDCGRQNRDTANFCILCGMALRDLTTGAVLQSRYRVDAQIGRGGMGAVYRVWDTRLDCACALKEMSGSGEQWNRKPV